MRIAKVKVVYEDGLRKVPATHVVESKGELLFYNEQNLVGRFPASAVEHWSFDEAK